MRLQHPHVVPVWKGVESGIAYYACLAFAQHLLALEDELADS